MVRLSFVITAVLVAAGHLSAQHSGGHASGGHSGASSGFHSSSGFASRPSYSTSLTTPQIGLTGINQGALPTGPYRIGRGNTYAGGLYGGRRYPAVYGYYPYFNPFFDYGYGFYNNGPDQDYGYGQSDPAASTANVTANLLGEQVERLSAEVEAMRNQATPESYAPMPRPRYNAPPMMPDDETPTSAPVTLVMRDGKNLKLNSYAVMGQHIWDFSAQPAKKIALASIDLPASQKATEAAGGEFPEIR
jgi:hypothetical protein